METISDEDLAYWRTFYASVKNDSARSPGDQVQVAIPLSILGGILDRLDDAEEEVAFWRRISGEESESLS